ncbi:hercynylcysteine sulfoxide lyase [Aspergillus awamori]|uniref:Hercynylcysteine sulfoxide lyase n=1 Tax=Aspergillus awamori TaxID=105351 RepID=A0A401KPZ9_ASPAW|nr:hercynylcysteine sulfoxide lyase [Aspergillus awamori]
MASIDASIVPFGAAMREQFLFDPNFLNLNHGSFGTYPAAVRTALRHFQDQVEARPDPFIRYTTPKELDVSREAVAKLLNVPRSECVFVKNATTGVNTVLHNLPFKSDDVIIILKPSTALSKKALYPLSNLEPLRFVVREARSEGLNVKLALFDVVTSLPAVRFPFERLTEVCRKEGILSLIDGAHGIGQLPLDLGELQPDFFTSNCHKWLFVPRSCCVLYVPKRNQHLIRTTIPTSWGFIPSEDSPATAPSVMKSDDVTKSAFESLFEFVATNDDTPYFCVPAALEFRKTICGGEERIYEYLERLANEAADIVAAALGTDVMEERDLQPGKQSNLRRCAMSTVRLPFTFREDLAASDSTVTLLRADEAGAVVRWFQTTLVEEHGTFVPFVEHGGWLWVRLSAQVYLERKDFEWLAEVLKVLCQRYRTERY